MCDAVLKKAMVLGLASLPRTAPVARDPWTRRLKLVAALVIGAFAVGVVAAIVRQLVQLLGPKP
jgi:hypothetical protein